jgi:transposase
MKKRKRWPRNEALYNQIQESEFLNFFEYVKWLGFKVCKNMRQRDILTCLLIWHKFKDLSARRVKGLLLLFKEYKIINARIPCFKTLVNYREDSNLQGILDKLIEESSKPLAIIENSFATDTTGTKTKLFSSWYSLRCKKRIRKRDHITNHVTIGTKSLIVTALNIEIKKGKDNIIFREHVDKVSENFKIDEWSGDGAYWAKENCKKIIEKKGKPYFNCKKSWNGKQGGVPSWKEMNSFSRDNPEEYGKHYHKRSKVESANHGKKSLFGDKVYSRLKFARINEDSLKWINWNINVLNRAEQEWDITPKFML